MWNVVWVTADAQRVTQVLKHFKDLGILTKCRKFMDKDCCFYEILIPAAETGAALEILAEM